MRILDKFFRREEINGNGACPTYLYRWTLLSLPWCKAYLHHFVGDDWSKDLHDHPKRFVTIGLRGRYCEETPGGERVYRAPWVRSFPATHAHRIRMVDGGDCWTVAIVFRPVRPWGFWRAGRWIYWREYVNSPMASEHRSCP